jgi:small subunit ribosomal protein S8
MINDPIADFLTRIRNAQQRLKPSVEVPASNMLVSIAGILKEENFIESFEVLKNDVQDVLKIELRYVNDVPAIRGLKRISRPGVRKYRGYKEIKPIKSGMGISVFSTPAGVISGKKAMDLKVGGEYICEIY